MKPDLEAYQAKLRTYNAEELLEIHGSLDREAYPEKFAALQAEMARRGAGFTEEKKGVIASHRAETAAADGSLGNWAMWKAVTVIFSILVSVFGTLMKCSGE